MDCWNMDGPFKLYAISMNMLNQDIMLFQPHRKLQAAKMFNGLEMEMLVNFYTYWLYQ